MRVVKEFRTNIFIIILFISRHSEGGVLSTKPDRSDQLELLEFHKEAFCGEQAARDDRLGLESYVNSILKNEKEGVRQFSNPNPKMLILWEKPRRGSDFMYLSFDWPVGRIQQAYWSFRNALLSPGLCQI